MKKILLSFLVVILLVACSTTNNVENDALVETVIADSEYTNTDLNMYKIDASLDVEKHIITAKQTIAYTNREGITLHELFIHTYPNAFSIENQPSIYVDDTNREHGALEVEEIIINGQKINFFTGPVNTSIKIDYTFEPNQLYKIDMSYKVKVAARQDRFGVINGIYNLCNWYPIVAVYDEDGWNVDPYLPVGDPFYSDLNNYEVTLEVPSDYVVAGSGYITDIQSTDMKKYHFKADNMRDFAMVVSDEFRVKSKQVNDTLVYLYYPKAYSDHKWNDDALIFSADSLDKFEGIIGDYPYKTYSVVMTNFDSGMEYPGLVLISTGYFGGSIDSLRGVIVHETVHQWFYGIIGGDAIDEGWIDEGLTSYFTAYFDKLYVKEKEYYDIMKTYERRVESIGFDNIYVAQSAYEFDNWSDYGPAAYTKPALLYHELHETYGPQKIEAFAKRLYEKYAYDFLKEEDLRETLVEIYGEEINKTLDKWWY